MSESPEQTPSQKLSDLQLVKEICSASNALEAHRLFEKNATALDEWQIIFAEESDAGSIKLLNLTLGPSGDRCGERGECSCRHQGRKAD